MIEFAFAAYVALCPPISALVGSRIYADQAQQGDAKPFIVYRLLPGSERHYHAGGASGLVEAAIEVTIHAKSIESARAVYEAVRNEVDGFRGMWDTVTVDRAVLSPAASATASPVHGDEPGDPAIMARLEVFYVEEVPTLEGPPL